MKTMKIERTSILTGITRTQELPITDKDLAELEKGKLIQDAMPNLTPDQREFFLTGVTPEEWDEAFGGDEDV